MAEKKRGAGRLEARAGVRAHLRGLLRLEPRLLLPGLRVDEGLNVAGVRRPQAAQRWSRVLWQSAMLTASHVLQPGLGFSDHFPGSPRRHAH